MNVRTMKLVWDFTMINRYDLQNLILEIFSIKNYTKLAGMTSSVKKTEKIYFC